jgi:[ribosomal protein S5]-alanine N-acetyltransferase
LNSVGKLKSTKFRMESDRLRLRPFLISDAEEAFQWLGDEDVMKFIPYGYDKSVQNTEKRLETYITHYKTYGYGKYIIIEKSTNKAIGDCGITKIDDLNLNEIGYRIAKKYWGKGFATEAANVVLKFAKEKLCFKEIYALVEEENEASVHMIKNKFGFVFQKKILCFGEYMDLYCLDLK